MLVKENYTQSIPTWYCTSNPTNHIFAIRGFGNEGNYGEYWGDINIFRLGTPKCPACGSEMKLIDSFDSYIQGKEKL